MKHIFTLFLVFLLPTLPTFGATQSVSKNNELFFSVKGEFTGYTGLFPSGVQVKITSPSECYITLAHKPKSDRILNSTFDRSIACPTGTNSITLEFTSNQTGVGQAKYTVKNPTHTIEIKSTKKNYKLPDIVLVQTNKSTSATPAQKPQKKETKPAPRDTYDELQTVGEIHAADAAEASEMEDAENAAEPEKLDLETRKELCATDDHGEWDTDNNKCKCKKGYKLSKTGECEPNKRTLSNNEKKALCEKNGAGNWTEKNKCECTDKTHSFDDELGCTENKIKTKRANKEAENDRKKELCTSPNTWNDTLNKCTCKDKKQFFDDELGCTAASQAFTNAEAELNTLKGQLDTKLTELASANESEEQ